LTVDARESPSGFPEALDEPEGYRIGPRVEHDRDALRSPLGRESDRGGHRIDQVNRLPFETPRRRLHRLQIAFAIAHVEDKLLVVLESQLPQPVPQPVDGRDVRASLDNDSHAIDASLLRLDRERQGEEGEHQGTRKNGPWRRHPNPPVEVESAPDRDHSILPATMAWSPRQLESPTRRLSGARVRASAEAWNWTGPC